MEELVVTKEMSGIELSFVWVIDLSAVDRPTSAYRPNQVTLHTIEVR